MFARIQGGCTSSFVPSLLVSPRASSLLEGGTATDLPPIPPGCESLVTYTLTIVEHVKDKIKLAHNAFEIRKQVVAQVSLFHYEKLSLDAVTLVVNLSVMQRKRVI